MAWLAWSDARRQITRHRTDEELARRWTAAPVAGAGNRQGLFVGCCGGRQGLHHRRDRRAIGDFRLRRRRKTVGPSSPRYGLDEKLSGRPLDPDDRQRSLVSRVRERVSRVLRPAIDAEKVECAHDRLRRDATPMGLHRVGSDPRRKGHHHTRRWRSALWH